MDRFTVEEMNLMCVFEEQERLGMIAAIKTAISYIRDTDMAEIAGQVLEKLETMSDEQFDQIALVAAE